MQALEQALPWRERLALAAALEYLTALVSRQALRGEGWLVGGASRQARLWRWHCAEELAHHGVALRLLREAGRVGYARRMGLYVLASLILLGDVARHTRDFARTDRARGWLGRGGGVLSLAGFALRQGPGLGRMAVGWLAYALPLRWLVSQAGGPQGGDAAARIEVRLLRNEDIPRLLVLERKKWDDTQAASAQAMAERIAAHPALCLGAFCPRTGEALASLFLKPISLAQLQHARSWADCVAPAGPGGGPPRRAPHGSRQRSISPDAGGAIFAFFWPRALQAGWRHI